MPDCLRWSVALGLLAGISFLQGPPPQPLPPGARADFDDYGNMLRQLGIKTIRRGPDPNNQTTFDEALANPYKDSMPDVLRMKDGTRVTTPQQWERRRKEIVEDFEREVYGRIPRNVPKVTWEVTGIRPGESNGVQIVTKTLVGHVDNRSYPRVTVDIQASFTVPVHATSKVPLMIEFGGFGPGPRVPGRALWTDQAIAHGWGYGSINPNSVQPDNSHLDVGIIGLCNNGRPRKPDDWGALRAWAWGVSEMITYFEKHPELGVDAKKVGVEGVSRYGKAAVVAEAFDPRVAVGFIGSSGEGGTKLHRHIFGEAVENLAGGEFYWMAGNMIKYGASDPARTAADMPVDSHELIALCAPRPCFISHGVVEKGDAKWIDVHGSFMAAVLAGPVYRLLGKGDLGTPGDYLTDTMPPVGTLIGGELAWRQHEGGHTVEPNWPSFFEWIGRYIPATPTPAGGAPVVVRPDQPSPRTDMNSELAHRQMWAKARQGKIDLYFEGDSITRRWGTSDAAYADFLANWKSNFWGWNAADFGWGGDTTQNILYRMENGELDGVNPKVIVILAGTNNVSAGDSASAIADGLRQIVEVCHRKAPRAKVILTNVLPRRDAAMNVTISKINDLLSHLGGVEHLDLTAYLSGQDGLLREEMTVDGLHLSVKGYQVWADHLRPLLEKFLGPRASTDLAPPPTGDPSAHK